MKKIRIQRLDGDLTALAWPSPLLTPLISNNSPITDSISFSSIVPEASTKAGEAHDTSMFLRITAIKDLHCQIIFCCFEVKVTLTNIQNYLKGRD